MNFSQTIFLVVDDFQAMRDVTLHQLRSLGAVKILTASNGAAAMKHLLATPVDVVLSDWNMPVMNGLELLKAVRANGTLARLPFVMITAEADRSRIQEAINNGVNGLLVKPYTAVALEARLQKALARVQGGMPVAAMSSLASGAAPAVPTQAATTRLAADKPGVTTKPTILVVDDVADNLMLLSNLFKDDYRVRVAQSGEKALQILQGDNAPSLVLLDIMMPEMDGFEVARRMREHPSSQHIPIIFVTAMTDDDTRLKGLELGAVDFVTKPINPDVLKPRVRNFLRYVELHKQLQADYDTMLDSARLREDVEQMTRHDLKGPLAGVIGLVQSLAQEPTMPPEFVARLHVIEEVALQVINLTNMSSELYKIESGRFELHAKPVKIGDILKRTVETARNTFAEKQVAIDLVPDAATLDTAWPQVLGDAMLCYSLFENLIKNACEAASPYSQVSVTLSNSSPVRIAIHNQGAVPLAIRERFFEKYATHGKNGGTGLGTYSAKLLAMAQQGNIQLEASDAQDTTTVTVTLPVCTDVAPPPPRPSTP